MGRKIQEDKVFMWIFNYYDFSVIDIVEIKDYEIVIDEETNNKTTIKILKETTASSDDIVAIKKNNKIIYWGMIDEIQSQNGELLHEYILKYITNIFDRKIKLKNESIIKNTGIEDFIVDTITDEYISNIDAFINLPWLEVTATTHTTKQTSVTNVENGIYNLHTWMTNCTQNYNIVYSFLISNGKLNISVENKIYNKKLIDITALNILNYTEVFEKKVISKVVVLYDKVNGEDNPGNYTLYLLNDKTTTTNMTDINRAQGDVITIYTENYEDANQEALNIIKTNSYNHNITFDLYNDYIEVGTPIAIKTKNLAIYDSYISAITITPSELYSYICGNIRIKFIDKLLKERRK